MRPLPVNQGVLSETNYLFALQLKNLHRTNLKFKGKNIFVLDEPATALDADHMEGFTRLLQMIKSQFKTVLLITHLDSLKDVVDKTIEIDKTDGYAHVNL